MRKSKIKNCSVPKKDTLPTRIRKNKVKISCILIFIFCVVLASYFYNFAKSEHKLGVFFDFWSNAIFQCIIAFLAEGGIVAFIKYRTKKKIWFLVLLLFGGTISFFSISGILKIQSIHVDELSNNSNNSDKDHDNETKAHESNQVDVYIKSPYVFEEDPFFTKKKEEYFGIKKGSLTEDDEIVKYIAKIILEDMKNTKIEHTEIPQLYEDCTQAAELLYQTYTYQRDRDWSKKNTYAVIVSKNCRIEVLVKAKDERINGDSEYQDYENRRIISIYFKELGDEYAQDNNQEEASEMFKESIKWAMKSLYTVYANKNYEKMKIIYNDLDNSMSALEQLNKINSENIANIRLCCDAYKLILDEYLTY